MTFVAFLVGLIVGSAISLFACVLVVIDERHKNTKKFEEISKATYKEYDVYEKCQDIPDRSEEGH